MAIKIHEECCRAVTTGRKRDCSCGAPDLGAPRDVWAHRDGSPHSADGPLGCFPCANERRKDSKA